MTKAKAKKKAKKKVKTKVNSSVKSAVKKPLKTVLKAKSVVKAKRAAKAKRPRRLLQIDILDQLLLNMAAKPYDKILKQIQSGKNRINEERRLALLMGTRILNKAKKVRDSLISSKNT